MSSSTALTALENLTELSFGPFDRDSIFDRMISIYCELTGARFGTLYLTDPRQTDSPLRAVLPRGGSQQIPASDQSLRDGITQFANHVYAEHRPMLTPFLAVPQTSFCLPIQSHNVTTQPDSPACVGFPLFDGTAESPRGVLTLVLYDLDADALRRIDDTWETLAKLSCIVPKALQRIEDLNYRTRQALTQLLDLIPSGNNLTDTLKSVLQTFDQVARGDGTSIWLIEGGKLVCRYGTGVYTQLAEQQASYDLHAHKTRTPFEPPGITAWMATSDDAEFVHTKTYAEMQAHPQYAGKHDSIMYKNDQDVTNLSFLAAPLIVSGTRLGVMKSNKLTDAPGAPHFFTDQDAQVFRIFSMFVASEIKSAKDNRKTIEYDRRLVNLYDIAGQCNALENLNEIFWYVIIGITNGGGIGLNRCLLFDVHEGDEYLTLHGRMAVGPLDHAEGGQVHQMLDAERTPCPLSECLERLRENGFRLPADTKLSRQIESFSIKVIPSTPLHEFVNAISNPLVRPMHVSEMDSDCHDFFDSLSFQELFVFGVMTPDGNKHVGVTDYVYTPTSERIDKDFVCRLLTVFLEQIELALGRIKLRRDNEEVREEAWKEFSAVAAHRISTEITDINGELYFLRQEAKEAFPERIARIEIALQRMQVAVSEYQELALGRTMAAEPFSLVDLLEEVVQRPSVRASRADVRRRSDYHDIPPFYGDRTMLSYVYTELLHNAIGCTGGTSKAIILVSLDFDPVAEEFSIDVEDNGPGVSEPLRSRVFEKGFTRRAGGTGLGLYIVKKYVTEHSGSIELLDAEHGAHFRIRLPLRKLQTAFRPRALLVEDIDNLRDHAMLVLKGRFGDIDLEIAVNESDARFQLANKHYDLVLTDVMLGDAETRDGGIRVLQSALEADPFCKVIVMTSHSGLRTSSDSTEQLPVLKYCSQQGAFATIDRTELGVDYLRKLGVEVERALAEISLQRQRKRGKNVFLSYVRGDAAQVREIRGWLSDVGFGVWLDEVDLLAGDEWWKKIQEQVGASAVFIPVVSATSVCGDTTFRKEVEYALSLCAEGSRLRIIPLVLERVALPEQLKRFHAVEAFRPRWKQKLVRALAERVGFSGYAGSTRGTRFLALVGTTPTEAQH